MERKIFICTVILAFFGVAVFAQNERRKVIEKAYKVTANTKVEVSNKYGSVRVNSWQKDSVKVKITLIAKANRPQNADKQINRVRFNMTGTGSYVVFKTIYGDQGELSSLVEEIDRLGSQLFNGYQRVTIDYDLFVPMDVELAIENRYGDVYLPRMKYPIRLDLQYGDLRARNIPKGSDITLKYVRSGIIDEIEEADMELRYSEVRIDEVEELDLDSRSSEIDIDKIESLRIKSAHDEIDIDEAEEVEGDMSFSELRIDVLTGSMRLDANYSDVKVKEIKQEVSAITLMGNYNEYNLAYDRMAGVSFDVSMEGDNKDLMLPVEGVTISNDTKQKDQRIMQGTIGKGTSSRLSISGRYSDIYVGKR